MCSLSVTNTSFDTSLDPSKNRFKRITIDMIESFYTEKQRAIDALYAANSTITNALAVHASQGRDLVKAEQVLEEALNHLEQVQNHYDFIDRMFDKISQIYATQLHNMASRLIRQNPPRLSP